MDYSNGIRNNAGIMFEKVHSAGIIDYDSLAGRRFGRRCFGMDFLAVTFGGESLFQLEDNGPAARLSAIGFVYVPAGCSHLYDPVPGTKWQNYWVLFDGGAVRQAFGELLPPIGGSPLVSPGRLGRFWEQLSQSILHDDSGLGASRAFCLLHNILLELRELSLLQAGGMPSPAIAAVIRLLRDHVRGSEVDLRAIAAGNGICPDSLRKRFRRETGVSLQQYFLRLKINAAQSMLSTPAYSIGEVAEYLGFGDPYYFARLFRKKTGMSPSQYRNELISDQLLSSSPVKAGTSCGV